MLLALRGLCVYWYRQHKTSRRNSLCPKGLYFKYYTKQNLCLYSPQWYKTGMMETCLNIVICVKNVRETIGLVLKYFDLSTLSIRKRWVIEIYLKLFIMVILLYISLKKCVCAPLSYNFLWNSQIVILFWFCFICV